jgi:hypothetical protein
MNQRSYGQVKAQLAQISGTSGFPMNNSRVMQLLNQATEELMNEGDWPGVVDRYLFRSPDGHIILPEFLDRIMGVAINNIPYTTKSPWYEFVEYGPGPQGDCSWVDAVIDRDEVAINKAQFPDADDGPWTLYTKCEAIDETVDGERPTILVKGSAGDERVVRTNAGTGWINGEELELNGDTDPYTFYGTAVFESVTAVIKPITNGYIELWATNGDAAEDVQLATYSPEQVNPSYHSYYLPALKNCWGMGTLLNGCCWCPDGSDGPTDITVLVRGRRRFVPVLGDDDELIITNIPALISMMMAIQKREVSDPVGYGGYKAAAVDIMQKEARSYRGKMKTPALTFDRGASVGFMPYVR